MHPRRLGIPFAIAEPPFVIFGEGVRLTISPCAPSPPVCTPLAGRCADRPRPPPPMVRYRRMEIPRVPRASFPECHGLPRVPNIGHSGKRLPRVPWSQWHSGKALDHPRVQHSGKRGTRGRKGSSPLAPGEESLFPECLALPLGEASLFPECLPLAVSSPSAMGRHPGNYYFFVFFSNFFESILHYYKLLVQIWGNFKLF
jgi:hypothetical protein